MCIGITVAHFLVFVIGVAFRLFSLINIFLQSLIDTGANTFLDFVFLVLTQGSNVFSNRIVRTNDSRF